MRGDKDRNCDGTFRFGHKSFKEIKIKKCSIDRCENNVYSRNMCIKHYQKWKKYGDANSPRPVKNKKGKLFYCLFCGKQFYRCPSEVKKGSYKYCSSQCGYEDHRGKEKEIKSLEEKKWYINKKGYLQTTVRRKRVLYHRWVMENYLNRPLKATEKVHHIDGNKLNNSIDNLVLMTDQIHSKTHKEIMIEYAKVLMFLNKNGIIFKKD